MTVTSYFSIWAGLFALTAGLGFLPEPTGFLKFCLVALSLGFFVPPFALLRFAGQKKDRTTIILVRNLAIASLALTVLLIIANFMSLMAPEGLGNVLHVMLTIVSAPMLCSQYWVLSLFLWACVLMTSISKQKK